MGSAAARASRVTREARMFAWIEVGGIEVGWVLVLVLLSGQNTERQIGASSECWTRSVSAKAEAAHGRGDAHVSEREQTTGGRAAIYDLPYATWTGRHKIPWRD